MKSIAIASLALAGSALARSTIHHDVRQPVNIVNADDELWGVKIGVHSEVNNFPGNSGTVIINHDDEADNELHNYYSMSGNQGNIQFNDYTVRKDDEADNELHNYYSMPGNQGNIQFNDYTVQRDATDDELWGVGIDVKSEVNNFPHNSGTVIINHDDEADNELHNYYSMPGNQGNIQFNDYTVQRDATDDELWGVGINVKSEVNNFPHNSGTVVINHDDEADNELHNYYSMSNNQGNIQFNDYSKTHDDELWGVQIGVKSEVNNFPHNSGTIVINHDDEADNELHNYYSMSGNQGNIQFNDYSKTHDDEFLLVAPTPKKLTHDELEVLASILKLATQDKEGNVIVDGVKIGKIPKQETKKTETPKTKTKKFLAL